MQNDLSLQRLVGSTSISRKTMIELLNHVFAYTPESQIDWGEILTRFSILFEQNKTVWEDSDRKFQHYLTVPMKYDKKIDSKFIL